MRGLQSARKPTVEAQVGSAASAITFVCAPLITTARKPRSSWRIASANRCAWCPRSGAHLWNRIHLCPAQPSRSLCDHLLASSAVLKTNILQIFSSKKLWFLIKKVREIGPKNSSVPKYFEVDLVSHPVQNEFMAEHLFFRPQNSSRSRKTETKWSSEWSRSVPLLWRYFSFLWRMPPRYTTVLPSTESGTCWKFAS